MILPDMAPSVIGLVELTYNKKLHLRAVVS